MVSSSEILLIAGWLAPIITAVVVYFLTDSPSLHRSRVLASLKNVSTDYRMFLNDKKESRGLVLAVFILIGSISYLYYRSNRVSRVLANDDLFYLPRLFA